MLKKTSHNADDPDIVCKIFNAGPQTADAADHHVNFYTSFRCFYQFRNDFFICQGINLDADIDADSIYDEDLDYREHMVDIIKRRKKLTPVRLEYTRKIDGPILDRLCTQLGIERKQTFYCQIPMDMSFFSVIQDTLRHKPDLFYPKRVSGILWEGNEESVLLPVCRFLFFRGY